MSSYHSAGHMGAGVGMKQAGKWTISQSPECANSQSMTHKDLVVLIYDYVLESRVGVNERERVVMASGYGSRESL